MSPAVDWMCAGGLSFLVFGVFLAVPHLKSVLSEASMTRVAAILAFVLTWPHLAATNYRLYASRKNILNFPLTSIVVPALMLCAVGLALHDAEGFGRWFVKIFLIWSPYHYSRQIYGLSCMYAARAGFSMRPSLKTLLSLTIYACFLGYVAQEDGERLSVFQDFYCPSFHVGLWLSKFLWASWGVLILWTAVAFFKQTRLDGKAIPPLMVVPVLSQALWFRFISVDATLLFFVLVPLFHSLQYLYAAGASQISAEPAPLRTRALSKWLIWSVTGGLALWALPPVISKLFGIEGAIAYPIVIAGINMHHFFVDGVVWKLRDSRLNSVSLLTAPSAA